MSYFGSQWSAEVLEVGASEQNEGTELAKWISKGSGMWKGQEVAKSLVTSKDSKEARGLEIGV